MATIEEQIQRERGFGDKLLEEYGSFQGILCLLPTLILLTLIVIIPMWQFGVLLSFQEFSIDPNTVNPWVGIQHYEMWLVGSGSALFLFSVKMTLLYELVVVPFDLVVALAAALVMNEAMPARAFFRGLMLAGYAAPPIAAGLLFGTMQQGEVYGVIYNIMDFFFPIPQGGGITGNTPWAFWGVVMAKVWRDFGFMYIVFLAGVQSIPSSLYEMAKVDGAGPVQRFRYITIPHLRTVLVTVVMIRTVFTIGNLDIPWGVTQGGPVNYTTFLSVLIFKKAFQEWLLGEAAALGMMFAIVMIPLILIWVRTETDEFEGAV